jgi:hypothetical protein
MHEDLNGKSMNKLCTRNLQRLVTLTREMLALADEGDRDRDDPHCGIIYGILRDSAYRLRKMAEEEIGRHGGNGGSAGSRA